jgi:hypothetical protein
MVAGGNRADLRDRSAIMHPARALAQLHASRERGVRSWRDERGDRIAVAAVAMEELAPRLAALATLESGS